MGMAAARKVRRSMELLEYILGIELLCGAQAVGFRRPLRSGPRVEEAIQRIRALVPELEEDRPIGIDIESVAELVRNGALAEV